MWLLNLRLKFKEEYNFKKSYNVYYYILMEYYFVFLLINVNVYRKCDCIWFKVVL